MPGMENRVAHILLCMDLRNVVFMVADHHVQLTEGREDVGGQARNLQMFPLEFITQ